MEMSGVRRADATDRTRAKGQLGMTTSIRRHIAGSLAMVACAFSGLDAQAQELSFEQLKGELEYVLELVTKRQLSDAEVERAAGEFVSHFDGRCDRDCAYAVEQNKLLVEPMATQPGSPRDLLARQWLSQHLYFSPAQAGSFIQGLSDEVDPIRLADSKSGRVMTQGDLLGLMNLNHLLQHGGEPTERSFARDDVEEHVSVLLQRFVEGPESLPYRATMAAELWAGVHQNWNELDTSQRDAVISYLADREFQAGLDVATYRALFDVSEAEAGTYQRDNQTAQDYARLEWITLRSLLVSEAATNVQVSGRYCFFCR